MKHYSVYELSMFVNGEMNFLSKLLCRCHLSKCRLCYARLRDCYRNEKTILEVKNASKHLQAVSGKSSRKDLVSGMFSEIDNNSSSW